MNKKKISLLLKNLELLVETLKCEIEDEEDLEPQPKNTVKLTDLIEKPLQEEDIDYYEVDEGPNVLLNNKEEREFYARFKLGD
jgi:hypothetical protein